MSFCLFLFSFFHPVREVPEPPHSSQLKEDCPLLGPNWDCVKCTTIWLGLLYIVCDCRQSCPFLYLCMCRGELLSSQQLDFMLALLVTGVTHFICITFSHHELEWHSIILHSHLLLQAVISMINTRGEISTSGDISIRDGSLNIHWHSHRHSNDSQL